MALSRCTYVLLPLMYCTVYVTHSLVMYIGSACVDCYLLINLNTKLLVISILRDTMRQRKRKKV